MKFTMGHIAEAINEVAKPYEGNAEAQEALDKLKLKLGVAAMVATQVYDYRGYLEESMRLAAKEAENDATDGEYWLAREQAFRDALEIWDKKMKGDDEARG